jgi:MFS family permease
MYSVILRPFRIWILALTVSLGPVLAILYTPALPSLAQFFQISEQAAQTSMTTYLLGYTIGILFYGPIANRWGRKTALFIGFFIAFLATLFSLWMGMAQLFGLFCFGRFIQGIGAASGLKVSITMVADTHAKEAAIRMLSFLVLAACIVPALGMGFGGTLMTYFGWEGCFIFMALYCLLLIGAVCFLPETAKEFVADALRLHRIVHGYGRQFKDASLVLHALVMGLCTSCYFIYATFGPNVAIEAMGLTPQSYGWLSWIPLGGTAVGCIIASHLAGRQSPRITMISGFLLALIGVLAMLICFANQYVNIGSFFVLMAFAMVGIYIISPTALSAALSETNDKSNASATSLFINMAVAFASIFVLSLIPTIAPIILPVMIGAMMVGILVIWLKLKARHQKFNSP